MSEACRLLDGLPLAIELAAARARSQPLERLVKRLREGEDVGSGRERRGPDRHRTLRQLIDWSHGLLDDAEKAAYRRLSVFAGAFPLEAAEEVVAGKAIAKDDVIELLGRLVERSLVAVESRDGEARYRLLETVKAHGRKKLDESGEEPEARQRHLEWYWREGQRVVKHLPGADAKRWLEHAEELREDVKAAAAWASKSGEVEAALEVAAAYGEAWHAAGHLEEARTLLSSALAASGAEGATAGRVAAVIELGEVEHDLGLAQEMRGHAEEGLKLARELGDGAREAAAADLLVRAVLRTDGPVKARAVLAGVESQRQAPPVPLFVSANTHVRIALAEGDVKSAVRLGREWLGSIRAADSPWDAAAAMVTLAVTLMKSGASIRSEAGRLLEESLRLRTRLGDMRGAASCLLSLGAGELAEGNTDASRQRLQASADLARSAGNVMLLARALNNLGLVAVAANQFSPARQHYDEALRIAARLGEASLSLNLLENVASLDVCLRSFARAARLLGATAAQRICLGIPAPIGDDTARTVQSRLVAHVPADDFRLWMKEGGQLTLAGALQLALEPPSDGGSSVA